MLEQLERPSLTLEDVTGFIGNGVPKLVERCLNATGGIAEPAVFEQAHAIFRDYYKDNAARLTRAYPGVIEALSVLQDAGVAMAVCTNKPVAPAMSILRDLGLGRFFGAIVGGDSLAVTKPAAEPLLKAIADLGGDPSCAVYVGDSETDQNTARAAGIPFVFFRGGYSHGAVDDTSALLCFDRWEPAQLLEVTKKLAFTEKHR